MDLLELHPSGTVGIVTRRVPRSPAVVDLVLARSGAGLPRFRPLPAELRSWGWRAELRLAWRHHCLVSVELTAWSPTTAELRLARVAAHALHWSDRRWDRYFAAAHAAADALVDLLETTPTGLPAAPALGDRFALVIRARRAPTSRIRGSAHDGLAPAAQNWNVF